MRSREFGGENRIACAKERMWHWEGERNYYYSFYYYISFLGKKKVLHNTVDGGNTLIFS